MDGSLPLPRSETSARAQRLNPPFAATLALFVLSGATGLIDQLCFSKYLTYIVGSTAHAVSAVLAAFMTGLAIGAHLGGRRSVKLERPLLAYGVLELIVALSVGLAPLGFALLTPLYVSVAKLAPNSLAVLSALRWVIAMLLVVVPTTAMGATLPLLSRLLSADDLERRERRLGALYAANTLGGGLGALAAAYLILPALGLKSTLIASAGVSALIGLAAIAMGWKLRAREPEAEAVQEASPQRVLGSPTNTELALLAGLALLSGWLVFASEVIFTHLLALVIGNSAYAFGLILAVFLSCLFVGASRAPAVGRKLGDAALSWGLVGAGAALALTLPLWDKLPLFFTGTGEHITSFEGREATRALAAFLILCLPVTMMGLTFPLLLQRVARYQNMGRLVGRFTAINTIGAVIGSMITGYLVLPWLGSQRALVLTAVLFVVAGVWTARQTAGVRFKTVGAFAGVGVVVGVLAPRWDLARLTSGNNVYFDGQTEPDEILMMEEDVQGGVTTVTRTGDRFTLYTNGKFQGNTGWEMKAQRSFAHYPSLFVTKFDTTLVVGLGTGTTLGTIAQYPWKQIDVVEISPAIERAARRYFTEPNLGSLEDPRVRMILADGRNFMLVSDKQYDLISMELSSIWFAGAASLYSREFYKMAHQRLAPGGIFQQWVQLHHIRERDFATVLHTLRAEFPHTALFYGGGQGILVAADQPLVASSAHIRQLASLPSMQRVLPDDRPLSELLNDVLLSGEALDNYLRAVASQAGVEVDDLASTDDNLYLEYATPRGNVLPWHARERLVEKLERYRAEAPAPKLLGP